MIANPPIGAIVRGADAHGLAFEAEVVRHMGSATVLLSDGFVTPISLIHKVVRLPGELPAKEADPFKSGSEPELDPMRATPATIREELIRTVGELKAELDAAAPADGAADALDLGSWEDEGEAV